MDKSINPNSPHDLIVINSYILLERLGLNQELLWK